MLMTHPRQVIAELDSANTIPLVRGCMPSMCISSLSNTAVMDMYMGRDDIGGIQAQGI